MIITIIRNFHNFTSMGNNNNNEQHLSRNTGKQLSDRNFTNNQSKYFNCCVSNAFNEGNYPDNHYNRNK